MYCSSAVRQAPPAATLKLINSVLKYFYFQYFKNILTILNTVQTVLLITCQEKRRVTNIMNNINNKYSKDFRFHQNLTATRNGPISKRAPSAGQKLHGNRQSGYHGYGPAEPRSRINNGCALTGMECFY